MNVKFALIPMDSFSSDTLRPNCQQHTAFTGTTCNPRHNKLHDLITLLLSFFWNLLAYRCQDTLERQLLVRLHKQIKISPGGDVCTTKQQWRHSSIRLLSTVLANLSLYL